MTDEGDCEPVLTPLDCGLGVPAEHWLGCSGPKNLLWKLRFPEISSTPLEKKINKKV